MAVAFGSKEEQYIAQALTRLRIEWQAQVPLFGGRRVRGGLVVDFVVFNPWPQAIEIFGEYWHEGELDAMERYKLALEEQVYGQPTIIIWAAELETPQSAEAALRRELRLS